MQTTINILMGIAIIISLLALNDLEKRIIAMEGWREMESTKTIEIHVERAWDADMKKYGYKLMDE